MPNAISAPRALVALDEEVAEPVAIAAEILVAALRDQRLLGRLDDQPRARRVGLEPVAEALIGEVDERDQAALRDQVGDRAPLVQVEIGAGRIVAAAVEQDEIARLGAARARPSSGRSRSSRLVPGVIRIGDHLDARRRRSAAHDWARSARRRRCAPCGLAARDQLGAEPQRAAAARRLQADDPVVVRGRRRRTRSA